MPRCVPPSPHPHADMTDPHGTGDHVGGAEPPDGAGSPQLHSLQAHSQPQGHRPVQRWTEAHQTAKDTPPGRRRGLSARWRAPRQSLRSGGAPQSVRAERREDSLQACHTRQQHFRLRCSRREAKGEPGSSDKTCLHQIHPSPSHPPLLLVFVLHLHLSPSLDSKYVLLPVVRLQVRER